VLWISRSASDRRTARVSCASVRGGVGIGGSPATGSGAAHYGRAGIRPHAM